MSDIVIIAGEKCKLVTSMDELCVGAIVWYSPCGNCNGKHRLFLYTPYRGQLPNHDDGSVRNVSGFKALEWSCPRRLCAGLVVTLVTIKREKVYRVIDTADSSASGSTDRNAREKANSA